MSIVWTALQRLFVDPPVLLRRLCSGVLNRITQHSEQITWGVSAVFVLFLFVLFFRKKKINSRQKRSEKGALSRYIPIALLWTFLTGLTIPSTVIASSPTEFISTNYGPLSLVVSTFLPFAGLFLVYGTIVYLLFNETGKRILLTLLWMGIGVALVNGLFFGFDGIMSNILVYNDITDVRTTAIQKLMNGAVSVGAAFLMLFLIKKFPSICRMFSVIGCTALIAFSLVNCTEISVTVRNETGQSAFSGEKVREQSAVDGIIHLSKEGKNVVVLSLDRAISRFVPYILNETPELRSKFEGFVYYPNTVSFGQYTYYAAPALFGGYEYTLEEINKREKETLVEKHNEAISVLPVLFAENGFNVTVCDVPYANYHWVSDMSIYNGYEGIQGYNTQEEGLYRYLNNWPELVEATETAQKNNFIMYSLFRVSPYVLRGFLYNRGRYLEPGTVNRPSMDLLKSYSVLDQLPRLTEILDNDTDNFLVLNNDLTHTPEFLSKEEKYSPRLTDQQLVIQDSSRMALDGTELTMNEMQLQHYHVNISAFLRLGEWFDYLRENDVYDNTKIIIASDHGRALFDDMLTEDGIHKDAFTSLLLVKNFGSSGALEISEEYMTNADVSVIAVDGVIADPKNPFTDIPMDGHQKSESLKINTSENWAEQYGTLLQFDLQDGIWISPETVLGK